jgi:hypothetical protein
MGNIMLPASRLGESERYRGRYWDLRRVMTGYTVDVPKSPKIRPAGRRPGRLWRHT